MHLAGGNARRNNRGHTLGRGHSLSLLARSLKRLDTVVMMPRYKTPKHNHKKKYRHVASVVYSGTTEGRQRKLPCASSAQSAVPQRGAMSALLTAGISNVTRAASGIFRT